MTSRFAPDPETGLVPWHASHLTSVLRCGEAFRRRYIEGERTPSTTPQIRGTAVHRASAQGLTLQRDSQAPAPVDLYEDVAASEIDRARHGGATFTQEEMSAGPARIWGGLKDAAVSYARTYGLAVAPKIQPVDVETRVSVAGILPGVLLRGTLDLRERTADGTRILDLKTTERAPSSDAADRSQQLTLYDLLDTAQSGRANHSSRVALDYLVRKPSTGEVTPVRLESIRGPHTRRVIVRRLEAAIKSVQAGVFLPANPETDWWCSARWCEYHATCPFALRP